MVSPTLLSLPPEILSLIIKEVDAQDDAFRAVAQDWYTPASEVVLQLKSESNGRGVSSLYSSCKTLSSLAAPYLFQTVTPKQMRLPAFKWRIKPKHATRFRHLDFQDTNDRFDSEDSEIVLDALCSFPSLQRLTISLDTINILFSSLFSEEHNVLPKPTEEDELRLGAFLIAARRVQSLHLLSDREWVPLDKVLSWFPTLESLELVEDLLNLNRSLFSTAAPWHSSLRRLRLSSRSGTVDIPPEWVVAAKLPALESLAINGAAQESMAFVAMFCSSLRRLELVFPERKADFTPSFPAESSFRHLRHLVLRIRHDDFKVIDLLLKAFACAPLQFVTIHGIRINNDDVRDDLLTSFLPTLSHLRLISDREYRIEAEQHPERNTVNFGYVASNFVARQRRDGVACALVTQASDCLLRKSYGPLDADSVQTALRLALPHLLRFGTTAVERYIVQGDEAGLLELEKALLPLKALEVRLTDGKQLEHI